MSNEDGFSVRCSSLKTVVSRKVILLFPISAVDLIFGMGFFSFFKKKLGFFCYSPKERKRHQWNIFIGISISISLRIRPSILWVGPGYNYTESSSSHQCVHIISCHLICSNCFYLQQIFFSFAAIIFYLQRLLFICSKFICFAATFLFAACPLWATVLNRGKRKSFRGKLHLWSNPVRKHLQKHKP